MEKKSRPQPVTLYNSRASLIVHARSSVCTLVTLTPWNGPGGPFSLRPLGEAPYSCRGRILARLPAKSRKKIALPAGGSFAALRRDPSCAQEGTLRGTPSFRF